MPQIRPTTDLRNTNEISELCQAKQEPNSYRKLALMSIETYESIMEGTDIDHAMAVAEAEYESGIEILDARACFSSLRRKHLG
ncbi:MAG: prevent-host-death protein [Cellulosilyticaceae bacterium]